VSKKRFYPRANPLEVAEKLHQLADTIASVGWEERGGYLIRGEDGEVVARTKWIPRAQWWAERPHRFSEQQTAGILLKHLMGKELTTRERECFQHLIDVAGLNEPAADRPNEIVEHRPSSAELDVPF
jgi:hypothetical protein